MDHNFIVTGTKFDFSIKPNLENKELHHGGQYSFLCVNGKIYLLTSKLKDGEGIPVKKAHFYSTLFGYFHEATESDMNRYTISDIRVAANSNFEFARQIYLDIYWGLKNSRTID